jgi:NAD(P)-dependent dehydrogenase (short-subunit alcohol dehydrogenase family)
VRMDAKIVVVTGAAQGIGAAIAQKFAEENAILVGDDGGCPGATRSG